MLTISPRLTKPALILSPREAIHMRPSLSRRSQRPTCVFPLMLFTVFVCLALAGPAAAENSGRASPSAIGKNASAPGSLFRQDEPGRKTWSPVSTDRSLSSGAHLMALPGGRAEIDTSAGVRLTLWGNVPELSRVPVMESVIRFNPKAAADVDLTLERGRILLSNRSKKTPAVRVASDLGELEVTLNDPESEVALELYSRWPPGVPFTLRNSSDAPTTFMAVHVLKGDASLKVGLNHYLMRPPPGPCYFHWDTDTGIDLGPRKRAHLPEWAEPDALKTPEAKKVQAAYQRLARQIASRPLAPALNHSRDSSDAEERRLAVYALGAIDDLPDILDALGDSKQAEAREAAIEALRNWIGRAPTKDRELYHFLVDQRRYTAGQAEIVLQLLHGLGNEARNRADTYETLIPYLQSSKSPVRALASWYLYRWVPGAEQEIPYNPAGSEAERQKAYQAWSNRLKEGKLPPKSAPEEHK